ncbi:ATP-dependent zinc protease [uncultured Halopseudomonas sp.]|mgnify:CR=1 FL=1|uniref:ATP-dependent zinc protease family protein n=1 Tax=uncultured Halopseudomonas sp. TaxID=2901193 RepID=UPI0030EC174C|tara:strand:+ start:7308 stop:7850 length:543 start_codon:yes stop_codon:yes gene_type:complete
MKLKVLAVCSACLITSVAALANQPNVYGLSEKTLFPELDLEVPAKLDTGAVTASLSAQNIQLFKRDGEDWVRFQLAVEGAQEGKELEQPVVRISKIKRRAADIPEGETKDYTARPVIEMAVCMGDKEENIEVNLTDRTSFSYPFLIGSTALEQFDAMVDPSLEYAVGSPACSAPGPTNQG